MQYDGNINIAVGMNAKSKIWKNTKYTWSKFVDKLKLGHKTNETFNEFIKATKDEQSKIKDVGGYVGGYLRNGRRKPENVVHRQLMTLDIDFAHSYFWGDFCLQFDNAAVLHGTHKWSEEKPRYRLIIPLSREATPDEYVAVSRQIAGMLNIDLFDNTTFETNRLMFWPSSPKDINYYFEFQDGPWVDVDKILDSYIDWKDSSLWPTAEKQFEKIKNAAEKQEDPLTKKGIVGAFCRAHTISDAISEHLSDTYVLTTDGRYTYTKGTTAAGMVVYDDKFAYSHHGTDPCGGKLCNAFDLVRIHKYGHLDLNPQLSGRKSKSFSSMEEIARKDKNVRKVIASENLIDAKYDFVEDVVIEEEDIDWMDELEVDTKGKYVSSASNISAIFSNDVRIKNTFKLNDFDGKRYVFKSVPWRKIKSPEPVKNVDYSGIRNYLESLYGVSGTLKIDDALALEFEKNHYHPIRNYLNTIEWDGVKRVDTLLIDYFGAEDTLYTREAMRKMLVGAVGRVFNPGIKFDLVLTLVSQQQGTGKSSFLKKLGQEWFSDTFMTVHGKEALEQIQGSWIIEIAELSGFRKAEVESIKHFMSKQEDTFRQAYARESQIYKRQCVFAATTNRNDFLKDTTGNRRFLPVSLHNVKLIDNNKLRKFLNSKDEIDQVWAEAVELFNSGEPLYMSKEANYAAEKEQIKHSEVDERKGIIENYLDTLLPKNWNEMDSIERQLFLEDPLSEKGTIKKQYVCIAEIWAECLGKEKENMTRYNTREINDILRGLKSWEQSKSTKNFKIYGKQRYYFRKPD